MKRLRYRGALLALALSLSACSSTAASSDSESSGSQIPRAFEEYEFSDLETFFGGGWTRVVEVSNDCGIGGGACAVLEVANDPECPEGFYAVVNFKDEYGDVFDTVRGRTLHAYPDRPKTMEVESESATEVKSVYVDQAGCI